MSVQAQLQNPSGTPMFLEMNSSPSLTALQEGLASSIAYSSNISPVSRFLMTVILTSLNSRSDR